MYQGGLIPTQGNVIGVISFTLSSFFLVLAAVAVGIRLWSRKIQRHGLSLNDYAAVLAWIFTASLVITSDIAISRWGDGKHRKFVNPAAIPNILKSAMAMHVAWTAANTSIRISIVHFYITIFRSNRVFLATAYAVLGFVIAFGVGVSLMSLLTCRPLAKYWYTLRPGVCANQMAILIALSSCNIAVDLIIILLPLPMVWGLQMATRRKLELTTTFALGFLVFVVTIGRLVTAAQIDFSDSTFGDAKMDIFTNLQPLLGIIVACLPIFPPALKRMFGHAKNTSQEPHNVITSSIARVRLNRSKRSAFQEFDDSLSLTDLENKRTENSSCGPSDRPDHSVKGFSQLTWVEVPPQPSIKGEQDWEVRSDEARHVEAQL